MYTFAAPAVTSAVIRNAELGNTKDFDFRQVNARTRTGVLTAFRDPNKPVANIFTWNFTTLDDTERSDIRTFLIDSAGLVVTVTDHTATSRNGYILGSGFELVTVKDLYSYSLTIRFRELDVETDGVPEDHFNRITEDEIDRVTEDDEIRVVENAP
jgi:hypothetical protein